MEHRSWDEVTVGENVLSSGKRKGAMIIISTSATILYTLQFANETFISVEKKLFRMYVTDAIGARNDCYIG